MTYLSKEAIERHNVKKIINRGGGSTAGLFGPKSSHTPPGPNSQQGGSMQFPNYGPTIQTMSSPPGPVK